MSSNPAIELASTLQSASINFNPSPEHDINPSTAASEKVPVKVSHPHTGSSTTSLDRYVYEDSDGIDEGSPSPSDDEEDIPYDVLRPVPRRAEFPPLPDLRFEQSYLSSISKADTKMQVALITVRDQIFMPLIQGLTWTLILSGWRHWNRAATLSGQGIGARVRRWWYETNNWKFPATIRDFGGDKKLARDMGDYYQNQSSGD